MSGVETSTSSDLTQVREHRGELEDLADSDLAVSWIAEHLLDAVDEGQQRSRDQENKGRA